MLSIRSVFCSLSVMFAIGTAGAVQAQVVAVTAAVDQPAAQAAPVFMTKAEIESTLIGNVWLGSRGVYGAMTQISYRPDHRIEVLSVDKSTTRKGTWDLDDQGQLCLTWAPGSAPLCYLYARSGAKIIVYLATDRVQPHAELLPKKAVN